MRLVSRREWLGWRRKSPAASAKRSLRGCARSIVLDLAQWSAAPWNAIFRAFARSAALADYYLVEGTAITVALSCCCPEPGLLTPESGSRINRWIRRLVRQRRTEYLADPRCHRSRIRGPIRHRC